MGKRYFGGNARARVRRFGQEMALLTIETIFDKFGKKLLVSLICSSHDIASVALMSNVAILNRFLFYFRYYFCPKGSKDIHIKSLLR